MVQLCGKKLPSRSKYDAIQGRFCQRDAGHPGRCDEFPYLADLVSSYPAVATKIIRDATMTTGAAWKSDEAGPNRILRWVMLCSDAQLKKFGIDMSGLKPQVVAKLREKSATYDDCMASAKMLAWLAYQMEGAPQPSDATKAYLEADFGPMSSSSTTCLICKAKMPFKLFSLAQRGKAEVETGHSSPRQHNPGNIGFAHRVCNIAQGARTLDEFYDWMEEVLGRVRVQGRHAQTDLSHEAIPPAPR